MKKLTKKQKAELIEIFKPDLTGASSECLECENKYLCFANIGTFIASSIDEEKCMECHG